jgi:hypothetical protein
VLLGLWIIRLVARNDWRHTVNAQKTQDRINDLLRRGPESVLEIYSYVPQMFWFLLGSQPKDLFQVSCFVAYNLAWFLKRKPATYMAAYGILTALIAVGLSLALSIAVMFFGVRQFNFQIPVHLSLPIMLFLTAGFGFYFTWLLERQVIALHCVANVIHELAAES